MTIGYADMSDGHVETGWIQTYSGKKFRPLDPDLETIDVRDIAHALAIEARFNGHTRGPYSVAQHSVLASQHARDAKLELLLHDAAEAYLKDLPRPVKKRFKELGQLFYHEAEDQLMRAIAEKFHLRWPLPVEVEEVDRKMLVTEARDLFDALHPDWHYCERNGFEPFSEKIEPWPWERAEREFLLRYGDLTGDWTPFKEKY